MDDAERFTEIFRTFHPPLTAYARRRVPTHVAQDVVAAVFAAAWRHLGSLPDEPLPWLYRAAFFEVATYRRIQDPGPPPLVVSNLPPRH